jgi:homoserine acetyltransferase
MDEVRYRKGAYFDEEAVWDDAFQSMDQIMEAARALERAGFVVRESMEGHDAYLVVKDITGADLAFAVSRDHRQIEEGR